MGERFTERSHKVVVLAQDEARRFNHDYIGTEHLPLGLLREDEGIPARVHSNLDVHPDKVRQQVLLILGEKPESNSLSAAQVAMDQWVAGNEVLFREAGRWAFQTLLGDLEYAYAVRDTNETFYMMYHKAPLDHVLGIFEGDELKYVKAQIQEASMDSLEHFPAPREIKIGAIREHTLEGSAASALTMTRTFRR